MESIWTHNEILSKDSFGSYAVGFCQNLITDWSRLYPAERVRISNQSAGQLPRPLFIASWYPCQSEQAVQPLFNYYHYLNPKIDRHKIDNCFISNLAKHMNSVLFRQIDTPDSHRDNRSLDFVDDFLSRSVGVIHEAAPIKNRFPLIIYHPGLGGSYEECSLLCTYLASHGFVVISSAFQSERENSLRIENDLSRSSADLSFLIQHCASWENIDWPNIAIIGHSYGAEAALYTAANNPLIKAVVMLDSTLDYDEFSIDYVKRNWNIDNKKIDFPIMAVAESRAQFPMLKQFRYSNRYLLSLSNLVHNDFLDHALIGAALKRKRPGNNKNETSFKSLIKAHTVQRKSIYQFLKFVLQKGNQPAITTKDYSLEILPATPRPMNFREIELAITSARKDDEKQVLLTKFLATISNSEFSSLQRLAYSLQHHNELSRAILVLEKCLKIRPESAEILLDMGDAYQVENNLSRATQFWAMAKQKLPLDQTITEDYRQLLQQMLRDRL